MNHNQTPPKKNPLQDLPREMSLPENKNPVSGSFIDSFNAMPNSRKKHIYFVAIAVAIFVAVYFISEYNLQFAYIAMATYVGFNLVRKISWYVRYARWMSRITIFFFTFFFVPDWAKEKLVTVSTYITLLAAGLLIGFFAAPFYLMYRLYLLLKATDEIPVEKPISAEL